MVRVSQRNKSPIEFIDLARKIADIVNDRMTNYLDKKIKKGVNITKTLPSWYAYLDKFNCYDKRKKFVKKFIK